MNANNQTASWTRTSKEEQAIDPPNRQSTKWQTGACLLFLAGCLGQPCAADVTFFDDTFNDADWTVTIATHGNGGTTAAIQRPSGGNTGNYREVEVVLNPDPGGGLTSAVLGFHWRIGANYSPATQGAIASLDYSEDAKLLSGGGMGQEAGLVLRQGTNIYVPPGFFLTPETSWTAKLVSGLRSMNFVRMLVPETYVDPAQHPDFSTNGQPIQFGFLRGMANGGSGVTTRTAGIDNWSVRVHNPPIVSIHVSCVDVCWDSRTNKIYQVQYRPALSTNGWLDFGPPVSGTGTTICVTDHFTNTVKRFYQVVELP
jgi:hypothetical protein